MSQHDMNIANQGFPNTRSDLNLALVALVSNSSGATAPSTMYAYQWWLDTNTTPTTLKMRNTANDAWISVMLLNQSTNIMSLSLDSPLTVAAGSAAAPSIVSTTGTADTGMWFPAADTVAWSTAGTERVRITSAGNVGIGTSLPTTRLTVGSLGAGTTDATYKGNIRIEGLETTLESQGGLEFKMTSDGYGAKIQAISSGGTNISFATRNNSATWTERMRISSSGAVLAQAISESASSGVGIKLLTNRGGVSNRTQLAIVGVESTSATSGFSLYSTGAAAYRFYIDDDGKPYSTLPLGTISDARLKTNIKNISYGLEDLLKIRPVNFDWKDGSDTNRVGFIAQELKPIISQAVTDTRNIAEDETPYMAVTESNLIPVMVKAIQEQQAIIETLTARITALENK